MAPTGEAWSSPLGWLMLLLGVLLAQVLGSGGALWLVMGSITLLLGYLLASLR